MMGARHKQRFTVMLSLQPSVRDAAALRCDISLLRIPLHSLVAAVDTKHAFAAMALRWVMFVY